MYKKILVAVDKSTISQAAFQQALELAKALTAKLYIIHVISPLKHEYQDVYSLSFSAYIEALDEATRERWETIEQESQELLTSLTQQANHLEVSNESTQLIGEPEETICRFIKEQKIDLIVVGSHGKKGFSELFLGSVSNYIAHHAACSVLIVHQPKDKQTKIQPRKKQISHNA